MEQQNKYRVIVSERATQMLISHAAFLAQVSPEAAERLTAEFEKTANSLELMVQRCPWLTFHIQCQFLYNLRILSFGFLLLFLCQFMSISVFEEKNRNRRQKCSP